MSSLYKRKNSPYYWWTTRYKGRKFSLSTKMTRKDHARKVMDRWNLMLMQDDISFLGLNNHSPADVEDYINMYLGFLERKKSINTYEIAKGVLSKFKRFLDSIRIKRIEEITGKVLDDYIDWLDNSPKTKKNYLGIVSLMLKQAIKEGVITSNPAENATLPQMTHNILHRPLEPIDLEIIFQFSGQWFNYYQFLYHTGLRAGDVALLTHGNIDRNKKAIVSFVRKSRRIHEFPIADHLLDLIPNSDSLDAHLFPKLYADTEKRLNNKLKAPRLHLQTSLRLNDRSKATLHSFRTTFNNTLRDLGLAIGDRQILLAHASSETTKLYTHPNFELAAKFVNRIPVYKS
ncbi:tyrosine-type recombinase/integrase [Candidatus Neomarinimicrobiota bacterium]